ncbi:MAG: recombination mediator RecR [Clostridia bacterium]
MAMDAISLLTAQLAKLPGIGTKSAQRLAYHILDMSKDSASEIASAILCAKEQIHYCGICGNYTDTEPCSICADKTRSDAVLCVVRDARDVLSMEKMREFRGKYHVLHGTISPMDGIGPDDIHIKELLARVASGGVQEIILATNPDVEGEATAAYIARLIKPKGVRVTRIAHGVPIGGNLEYIDEMTLLKAVEGRREM